jgi:hypothetical protein
MVLVIIFVNLIRTRQTRSPDIQGWRITFLILAGVTIVMRWVLTNQAGFVGAAFFLLFILLPSIAVRLGQRAYLSQDFERARELFNFVRYLHPVKSWREMPDIMRALSIARSGNLTDATTVLQRFADLDSAAGLIATIHLYALRGKWEELNRWLQSRKSDVEKNAGLLPHLLRASGETGDLVTMIQDFKRWKSLMEVSGMDHVRAVCQLFVAAFGGRTEAVSSILKGPLKSMAEPAQLYWLVTA